MSAEDRKAIKQDNSSRWETELWSYVSSGDGVTCPIYSSCHRRLGGGYCGSDHLDYIAKLIDDTQFCATKYDSVLSGWENGRLFQLVERLSQKYLQMGEVRGPPVPAELVSLSDTQHPIEVRLVPLKNHHGAIWYLKDTWVIQLNENEKPCRRRLALFHEAFHILAHRKSIPVFKKNEYGAGSFNELLADYFAASIMIPREWAKEKWIEVKDLDKMVKIFHVPKVLIWLRLREIGLI